MNAVRESIWSGVLGEEVIVQSGSQLSIRSWLDATVLAIRNVQVLGPGTGGRQPHISRQDQRKAPPTHLCISSNICALTEKVDTRDGHNRYI